MGDLIARATELSRRRLVEARAVCPMTEIRSRALDAPAPASLVLGGRFDLIAEVKLASPSQGPLTRGADGAHPHSPVDFAARMAREYDDAGACAISVLTEPEFFSGSLDHLRAAARVSRVPVMRKDFLVDPYQVLEARAAGAGGVLLILRSSSQELLVEMLDAAKEFSLFVLLEAFDAEELARASALLSGREGQQPPILVGVNTRNLETLDVDPRRLADLAPRMPDGFACVAESGLLHPEDAARAAGLGYDVALVGSALVRAEDPGGLIAAMLQAGRGAVRS